MAIYMQLGKAKGDVTEAGHKQWCELAEASWSMSRTIRSAVGTEKGREHASAYVSEMSVTKLVDAASSEIAQQAFVGEAQDCEIDFTRVDKGKEAVFRKIKLEKTIISGMVNEGEGNARPTERLTLNFTKIVITDTTEAAEGKAGSNSTVTYDLGEAQTK